MKSAMKSPGTASEFYNVPILVLDTDTSMSTFNCVATDTRHYHRDKGLTFQLQR